MELERSQNQWLDLVRATTAGKSDVAAAMRKLVGAARRADPGHPAWKHIERLDFAGDAERVAAGVRKMLASRKLKPAHRRVVFELDPVNLGGDGGINVFAGEQGEVDLGLVRSRVLAKLYDWAEDGDAADVLVGLGFTAVAIARAVKPGAKDGRKFVIAYHDSNLEPLVLGEPARKSVAARVDQKPAGKQPAKRKGGAVPSSPAEWRLRAAKYGGVDAVMNLAIAAVEAGDRDVAKKALAELSAALKRPAKEQYDERLEYIGALYFVAERLGDRAKVKQATQLYERIARASTGDAEYDEHVRRRVAKLWERYRRGVRNGEWWPGSDDVPLEVWTPLMQAMRAGRDRDASGCRAALKRVDAAVAREQRQRDWRDRLKTIGGAYALLHGFCGNAAKVREILKRFDSPFDAPKPEQAFTALFEAGDTKGAAAVASRELKERLDEVTGKAGVIAAMNAHHSLGELEEIFDAQLKAGDRAGVARGLDAVENALGRKARNPATRAWALKTAADLELRIGRPDRARAANELAEKLAPKTRGAEIRSMSWRGVAEVYGKLGEWEKAAAAIAKIPSRHEKLGATIELLVRRGEMDQVAREVAKMKGNEAKRDACRFVAEVLEEMPRQ